MLHESNGLWVEQAGRIATLQLNFPGAAPNRLNGNRIAEIGRAVVIVARNPFVEILVVRSAKPGGFSAGYLPEQFRDESDAWSFAKAGRTVLAELAELPIPTLALIDGPCHSAGLELAMACDYRLAVATPDTWIGLGEQPCWGGTARLRHLIGKRSIGTVTAREAQRLKLVDLAFCHRRAKIELRTFLDRLEHCPRKRPRPRFPGRALRWDAEELRAFLSREPLRTDAPLFPLRIPDAKPIDAVRLTDCPQAIPFAVEYVLRGGTIVTDDPQGAIDRLAEADVRGRATPLELVQARSRILVVGAANVHLQGHRREPHFPIVAKREPYRDPIRVRFLPAPTRAVEISEGPASQAVADVFSAAGFVPRRIVDSVSMSSDGVRIGTVRDREEVESRVPDAHRSSLVAHG